MESENIVGFVHANGMSTGLAGGYAIYVTEKRIMGAKKFTVKTTAAYLDEGTRAGLEYFDMAEKVKQLIEAKKDFEFTVSEVETIEMKAPGFFGGYLKIRTPHREVKVKIGDLDDEIYNILREILVVFAPDKVKEVGKKK